MLSSLFPKILFFLSLFSLNISQLTIQDKKYIENFIYRGQSRTSGLFFEETSPFLHTYQSIFSLKALDLDIKFKNEICDKISDSKKVTLEISLIDSLLECKTKFPEKKPELKSDKFIDIYKEALLMDSPYGQANKSWADLYKAAKSFISSHKFTLEKSKDKKTKSILATAYGIEIYAIIAKNDESLKKEVIDELNEIIHTLIYSYMNLNDYMIVFNEKNVGNYELNYHVIKALKSAKKAGATIKNFNDTLYKLLNYFITFKYEFAANIENTYYLLSIYKLLDKTPLMKLPLDSFNYKKDNKVKVKFENVFGGKIEITKTTITLSVKEDPNKQFTKDNKKNKKKKSSSYDLDDSTEGEEDKKSKKENEKSTSIQIKEGQKENSVEFELGKLITSPGYYIVSLDMDNAQFSLKEHLEKKVRSYSEIKLNSMTFEIIDKIDEAKNQNYHKIKSPAKYKESFKANQDNTLIVRLKVDFDDKEKPTQTEQVFLRLKNTELNKSYNAYASKFTEKDNEYFIGFELDDPVKMESYNGQYEMYIVLSDPGLNTVQTWEFGSIEISFTKPTDPLDEEKNLKNQQQPKMEPTFSPETNRAKNQTIGVIFSMIILGLTVGLCMVLIRSKSNVENFPKVFNFGTLMNLLFVTLLGVVAFILFMFWVKWNILQTMFYFVVLLLPASFIIYKALKNHQIEIDVEKTDKLE